MMCQSKDQWSDLIIVYAQKGDYVPSIDYYDKAIELGRSLDAKSYLCRFLYARDEALLKSGEKTQGKRSNEESLAIAQEIGHSDILFKATLIKDQYNKDSISLRNMLNNEDHSKEERAALYYKLGQLKGSREELQKAAQLNKKLQLYQKTPKYEYMKRMESIIRVVQDSTH